MSHSFYISEVQQLSVDNVLSVLGLDDVRWVDDHAQPENGQWPQGTSYLYRYKRSVRPIQSTWEDGRLQLRIFAYSSPADYQFAMQLVEQIAQLTQGSITPEDSESVSIEQLKSRYGDEWIRQHCQSMLQSLVNSHRREPEGEMQIMGTLMELRLGARMFAELLQDPQRFSSEFYGRFRRLNYLAEEGAQFSQTVRLKDMEKGEEFTLALYKPGQATALLGKPDYVALSAGDENREIGFEPLVQFLGERGVWLSENVFLAPALAGPEWAELWQVAQPVAERTVQKVEEVELSGREEQLLVASAPLLVFALVAGADGKVDSKEFKSFQQQLIVGTFLSESRLFSAATQTLIKNFPDMLQAIHSSNVQPLEMLAFANASLDQLAEPSEVLAFRRALLDMGRQIAESSGGFLGFGSKVSKQERAALESIARTLGL